MSVIRVNAEVYEELKKLKRKLGAKSMSELISLLIKVSKEELDKFKASPYPFLRTLKFAGEAGEHDSERIDELLYGENN